MTGPLLACDYSFAHPTPPAIKRAGYVGVLRYLSQTPRKDLTPAERDALHAAGLGILLAWETTSTRARTGGSTGGSADGASAKAQAVVLGYPQRCPIFFAVDENDAWAQVAAYFGAARAAAAPYPVRPYGSLEIVEAAYRAGFGLGWQTEAWSGTTVSPNACLYQRVRPTLSIAGWAPGTDYDEDVVLVPTLGWWDETPVPVPTPIPLPVPASWKGPAMVIVRTSTSGSAFLISGGKRAPIFDEATVVAFQAAGVPVVNLASKDWEGIVTAFA